MSKVYIINDGDIEKLTLALDLSKFKANFPLYKLQSKPDDMTAAEEEQFRRRWEALVDEAHRHFNYYVVRWLQETVK